MLLLVCRLHQRNLLIEAYRRNYNRLDNEPQGNVELNNQGEGQPLVVNAPAEEEQQPAEEEQQPAEEEQQPAEEEQQPAEEEQQPVEEEQQPAEQHCQIL